MFLLGWVAAALSYFIALEVGNLIGALYWFLSLGWPWTVVALNRIAVIYVAAEAFGSVEPRAGANEYSTTEPLRSIVAIGGAVIGRNVIVTVWTGRRRADADAYLSLCCGSAYQEADSSNDSES
jgi:hypothetical protein